MGDGCGEQAPRNCHKCSRVTHSTRPPLVPGQVSRTHLPPTSPQVTILACPLLLIRPPTFRPSPIPITPSPNKTIGGALTTEGESNVSGRAGVIRDAQPGPHQANPEGASGYQAGSRSMATGNSPEALGVSQYRCRWCHRYTPSGNQPDWSQEW